MKKTAKTKQEGELVFGIHSVTELLTQRRRKVISIYTTNPQPKAWASIEKLKPNYPINIQYVDRDILTRIAGSIDHQGILAWAQPFPLRSRCFSPDKHPFVILLDGIQDPRNLGAIIRSAYCTGANGIIIPKKHGSSLTAIVHKASAGLAERSEIYSASTSQAAIQELKQAGYQIYLATLDGADATTVQYQKPLCLVIGSEGSGIQHSLLNQGTRITIPQQGNDVSYNASVAAGILLFTIASKIR